MNSLRIIILFVLAMAQHLCYAEDHKQAYELYSVDSVSSTFKSVLNEIERTRTPRLKLVVTKKKRPGVKPEFHHEIDSTINVIYAYSRNHKTIEFESHPGLTIEKGQKPFAVMQIGLNVVLFDESVKQWIAVSRKKILQELTIGNCTINDGLICVIRVPSPLPKNIWNTNFDVNYQYP